MLAKPLGVAGLYLELAASSFPLSPRGRDGREAPVRAKSFFLLNLEPGSVLATLS
jgi:hypothetical protein